MFVGHYAAAFALKAKEKKASLGMLFLAVQFVDILFFPLTMLGIEKINFVEGFTETNNFDLAFMPYTHGLLGSLLWAIGAFILFKFGFKQPKAVAWAMAMGVLSHWFADLIAHTPDLPLISGEPKFGFGLWKSKALTFITEALLLVISLAYYIKSHGKNNRAIGLVAFLILASYLNFYVLPQENDLKKLVISALAAYGVFAGIAFWAEKSRL